MNELSMKNLLFIENDCVNPQDAIIIRLLLEGVELYEISYLQSSSLDPVNKSLTIEDVSGRIRQQRVSQQCMGLYEKAIKQTQYFLDPRLHMSRDKYVELRASSHLIKVSLRDYIANEAMIQEMDSVRLRTIYKRIRQLSVVYSIPDLGYLNKDTFSLVPMLFA